jgi:hypothetical protein
MMGEGRRRVEGPTEAVCDCTRSKDGDTFTVLRGSAPGRDEAQEKRTTMTRFRLWCFALLWALLHASAGAAQDVAPAAVVTPSVAPAHLGMGVRDDSAADLAAAVDAEPPARGQVPAQVDLSPWFPAPGSQGTMGTCVGWALANLATFHQNEERRVEGAGAGPGFSPLFLYNIAKEASDNDCSGGLSVARALNVLRDQGVAPIARFPYTSSLCGAAPDADVLRTALPFRIASWAKIHEHDGSELKSFLAARRPVVLSVRVDRAFEDLRQDKYARRDGTERGFHALLLVGYDDTKGAWKVLNSWGRDWGEGGYGWIDYAVWNDIVRAAYVTEDRVDAPAPPTEQDVVVPVVEPPTPSEHVVDRSTLDDDLRLGLTADQFSSGLHEYARGVEVDVFEPYVDAAGETRFNAHWRRGAPARGWSWNHRGDTLNELYQRHRREGVHLSRLWVTQATDGAQFHMSWRREGRVRSWSVNYGQDTFAERYREQVRAGWQIAYLYGTVQGAEHLMHAVWEDGRNAPGTVPNWFDRADTFARNVGTRREAGYQLVELAPVVERGRVYFHSVFRQQSEATTWSIFDSSSSFHETGEQFRNAGYSPSIIEVTVANGAPSFHSVWTRRTGCAWAWNHTARSLASAHAAHLAARLRMTWLRSYDGGEARLYTAIWCAGPAPARGPPAR